MHMYLLYTLYIKMPTESMMTTTISAANARKEFADILNKVAYGSETIVLTRRGKEVAALISMEDLALLQRLEDYIDIEDAKKALAEPGENIPAREFWEQLGL